MANTLITTEAFRKGIEEIFDEVYSNYARNLHIPERYILEQCGKQYRVKDNYADAFERYKTGWLNLKQAQGFLKLLKGNEQDDL
jgi:hypothetical protein